jgi:hypothetical protein
MAFSSHIIWRHKAPAQVSIEAGSAFEYASPPKRLLSLRHRRSLHLLAEIVG